MSTYNGQAYVADQVESVLAQDVGSVRLVVRDDGSTDNTVDILREFEREGALELIAGKNVGLVRSTFELLAFVKDFSEYIALCDQDDVWHSDKLSRALEVLGQSDADSPCLYCSEYIFCDEDLNPVARSHLNRIGVHFPTMLYENMVSGNTCVMNRALANLVVQAGNDGVYCHDWWLGLVACAVGKLFFDDHYCLDYRRTGTNVSPTGSDWLSLLKYRYETFFRGHQMAKITNQLERFCSLFAQDISCQDRDLLETCLNGTRASKAFCKTRFRQKLFDELALRILFLVGIL